MGRKPVFYSFHYGNDVMRVQQVRNIGVIEGNNPVSPNEWETVKRAGSKAIQNWIDQNMKYKQCVIVLVGAETASRPWVQYEIQKAWNERRPIFGVYIHNLKDPRMGVSAKGSNPCDQFTLPDGSRLSQFVACYDPAAWNAYGDIAQNMSSWVDTAIAQRR